LFTSNFRNILFVYLNGDGATGDGATGDGATGYDDDDDD
jgi:hypothetical protein